MKMFEMKEVKKMKPEASAKSTKILNPPEEKLFSNPPCFLNDSPVEDLEVVFGTNGKKLYAVTIKNQDDLRHFAGIGANIPVYEKTLDNIKRKNYVFQQHVGTLPVFASMITVQTDEAGRIVYVNCNFSFEAKNIKEKEKKIPDTLMKELCKKNKAVNSSEVKSVIFAPALIQRNGPTILVWMFNITETTGKIVRFLVCQKTNKIVFSYPLTVNNDFYSF